jgi:parallel beta-helix repeat protein
MDGEGIGQGLLEIHQEFHRVNIMSISSVEWRLDGVRVGSIQYSAPYSLILNTAAIPNGTHTISTYVLDAAGNSSTQSRTVIIYNAVPSPDPVAPSVSTIVSTPTVLRWATANTLFTNTLEEHSLASIESELLIDEGTGVGTTQEKDGFLNVLDYGAVGDGTTDDTIAIQNTINLGVEQNKGVLIPSGKVFAVRATYIDSWANGTWGQIGYVFKIPSNTYIRLNGTIKLIGGVSEGLTSWPLGYCIFENENSFRFISGSTGTNFPEDYTLDKQGLYDLSGCHTNGVSSNVLQIVGDVDLSSVEVGVPFTCPPVEGLLPLMESRNIEIRVESSPFHSVITDVDNASKTVTVLDLFNISSSGPRSFTIENNLYDENITIEGKGLVDLSAIHSYTSTVFPETFAVMLCRFYRVKNLTVSGITIIGHVCEGFQIGFSQNVTLSNVIIKEARDGHLATATCGNFDICRNVLVENCFFYNNPVSIALFFWACRYSRVIDCISSDMPYGGAGLGGLVEFQSQWGSMEFGGESLPTNCVQSIATDTNGVWGIYDFGQGTSYPDLLPTSLEVMIDWAFIVDGCISARNGSGINLLAQSYYGGYGKGIKISNNIVCSNKEAGIFLQCTSGVMIENNIIKGNGWGDDPSTLYYPARFNYHPTLSRTPLLSLNREIS